TDHDTTDGLEEADAAGRRLGVEVVPGVEFSAEYEGTSVHVLCYWMDPASQEFGAELRRLIDSRFRRGELMVEKLQALGYPISFERVRQIAGGGNIVRPHVARAMVEAGIVADEQEAFDRFIADGGPVSVPKHALDPVDSVGLIRRAGGVCVLAHPGMWGDQTEVPTELIEAMADAGMVGLEVDHTDHTPEQRVRYRALALRLDLVPTGGSDCHGARYDPVRLGTVTTDPEAFATLRGLVPVR
ncbi:MAG TPA: PHP domain-containing protein, partial [Actinomycetota bacterium]